MNIRKISLKALGLILASSLPLTACGAETETAEETQEPQAKRIEIFTVGVDQTPLSFTKSGQIESGTTAYVSPQIAGKITNISINVGDKVNKNQTLATLGDSLSTDSAQMNANLAKESLQKLYDTRFKTDYVAQTSIDSAIIGYYTAIDGLDAAIKSRDHAEELYEEQHDTLEDTLDDLKDLPNYKKDPLYKQTKSQLEQMEIGHEAQEDQLDLAIEMSKAQLEGAILAVEGVQAQYSLQFIQLDSTILQAETGADLAKLQAEARNIKSPIKGTISSIQAEEGNFTSPGQILLTVENIEELKVKTYLSPEESTLVKAGNLVSISTSTSSTTGTINYISPTLSLNGKAEVEITISDKKNLFSGEIIEVTFTPNLGSIATLIPLNSLVIEDKHYFINTVATDKTIERKEVTIGQVLGNYVEILEGINFGEKVALSTVFLREGEDIIYKVKRSAKSPKS
jgi:RND family efflux transporter MFP subunit